MPEPVAPAPALPAPVVAPDPLPDYEFSEMAERSRGFRFGLPGWRRTRNGGVRRPDDGALDAYARVFLKRLRVCEGLLLHGLPREPRLRRLLLRHVGAVHGRVHWYEATLAERNLWFQLYRALAVLLVGGAVAFAIWSGSKETGVAQVAAVVAALSYFAHFVVTARNDKGEIDAYIAALVALKGQLTAFEGHWDDLCAGAAAAWPDGFAAALNEGIAQADAIEDAERMATLQSAVSGFVDAAASAQMVEGTLTRVAGTRTGARARVPSPLEAAEEEAALARAAEERAAAEDWGALRDTMLSQYKQARIAAETRAELVRRQPGRG